MTQQRRLKCSPIRELVNHSPLSLCCATTYNMSDKHGASRETVNLLTSNNSDIYVPLEQPDK